MPTLSGKSRSDAAVPRYMEIARQIEAKRQTLSKPLRLPSEPKLAGEYRIARDTLRRALVELEKIGAVTRQRGRGRGTYLRPRHFQPTSLKGKTIAFVPPWWRQSLDAWYLALVLDGVSTWGDAHDSRLSILHIGRWENDEHKLLEKLTSRDVAGVIWVQPVPEQKKLLASVARHVPCVVVGREYEGENLHAVLPDYQQAAKLLDAHLVARGHRVYSVVGRSPTDPYGAAWLSAFQEAQLQRGGFFEDHDYYINITPFNRDRMADLLMEFHLDFQVEVQALVLTSSIYLAPLLANQRFRDAVPSRFSLTAFDFGVQPIAMYWPGHLVTHVTCDWKEIGRKAIETIFSLVDGDDAPRVIIEGVKLVEGDTVEFATHKETSPSWRYYHEGFAGGIDSNHGERRDR